MKNNKLFLSIIVGILAFATIGCNPQVTSTDPTYVYRQQLLDGQQVSISSAESELHGIYVRNDGSMETWGHDSKALYLSVQNHLFQLYNDRQVLINKLAATNAGNGYMGVGNPPEQTAPPGNIVQNQGQPQPPVQNNGQNQPQTP